MANREISVGIVFKTVGEAALKGVATSVNSIGKAATTVGNQITNAFKHPLSTIKAATAAVNQFEKSHKSMASSMSQGIQQALGPFLALQKVFQLIIGSAEEFEKRTGKTSGLASIKSTFSDITAQIGAGLYPAFEGIANIINNNKDRIMQFGAQVGKIFAGLINVVVGFGQVLLFGLDSVIGALTEKFYGLKAVILSTLSDKEGAARASAMARAIAKEFENSNDLTLKGAALLAQGMGEIWRGVSNQVVVSVAAQTKAVTEEQKKAAEDAKKIRQGEIDSAKKMYETSRTDLNQLQAEENRSKATRGLEVALEEIRIEKLSRDERLKIKQDWMAYIADVTDRAYNAERKSEEALHAERLAIIQKGNGDVYAENQRHGYKVLEIEHKSGVERTKLRQQLTKAFTDAEVDRGKKIEDAFRASSSVIMQANMTDYELKVAKEDQQLQERLSANKAALDQGLIDKDTARAADLAAEQLHQDALNELMAQRASDRLGIMAEMGSQIQSISSAFTQMQLNDLDKETEKRKASAGANIKNLKVYKQEMISIEEEAKSKREAIAKRDKQLAFLMAIVNTATGVTKALASSPPPLNFIMAGLVGAAGAAQATLIASQAFAEGGVVQGNGPQTGDNVLIRANPGELILTREQQSNLLYKMSNAGAMSSSIVMGDTTITINGNADERVVRRALTESREKQLYNLRKDLLDLRANNMLVLA